MCTAKYSYVLLALQAKSDHKHLHSAPHPAASLLWEKASKNASVHPVSFISLRHVRYRSRRILFLSSVPFFHQTVNKFDQTPRTRTKTAREQNRPFIVVAVIIDAKLKSGNYQLLMLCIVPPQVAKQPKLNGFSVYVNNRECVHTLNLSHKR